MVSVNNVIVRNPYLKQGQASDVPFERPLNGADAEYEIQTAMASIGLESNYQR